MSSWDWLEDKFGLSPEEAAIYEWKEGFCGDFHNALWRAISLADSLNMARLSLGFPVETSAYMLYSREAGWWQKALKKIQKAGQSEDGRA